MIYCSFNLILDFIKSHIFRNILLEKHDNIKISDMDIARSFNTTSTQEISTFAGTRAYMSPEILEGKSYSYETDIW